MANETIRKKDPIIKNGFVGRAVYDKDDALTISQTSGEILVVNWRAYYDSRIGEDISVDHFGTVPASKKIMRYLRVRAEYRNDGFLGWSVLKVDYSVLANGGITNIYYDPIVINDNDDDVENNIHHAQIDRGHIKDIEHARCTAAWLAHCASQSSPIFIK